MNKYLLSHITNSEFSQSLRDDSIFFENKATIGICVSGGVDSLALMILMHNWVKNKNYSLIIFYFNHKLRKDSDDELKFVKNLSKDFNIKFKSFNWLGTKPSSAIMKLARDVRYKTIFDYCKKNHIIHLMTAHHLDDLIETFFMRLQRKFSTIGLRSISKKFCNNDLVLYRPLLKFKKKRLILTCKYHDLKWVEDKSNKDIQYERVRVRNYLKENPQQNLKLEKDLKSKIYQNNELEKKIGIFFLRNLKFYKYGVFEIDYGKLKLVNLNLKIEILKKILVTCSGKIYPPRLKSVVNLIHKIFQSKNNKQTLHGCIIECRNKTIIFFKEFRDIYSKQKSMIIKAGESIHWDNRFRIFSQKKIFCETFNDEKWLLLKDNYKKLKDYKEINYEILKTFPVLRLGKEQIIPFLFPKERLKNRGIRLYFEPLVALSKNIF